VAVAISDWVGEVGMVLVQPCAHQSAQLAGVSREFIRFLFGDHADRVVLRDVALAPACVEVVGAVAVGCAGISGSAWMVR
jgi:hypothetical protein